MVSSLRDDAWLAWIERLARNSGRNQPAVEFPGARFYCCLDQQPDHLVPERYLRAAAAQLRSDQPLFVNPNCSVTENGSLPDMAPCTELVANFALQGGMLWINDAGAHGLQPFWLGSELSSWLEGLQGGDPAPAGLPEQLRQVLQMAGALQPDGHDSQSDWARAVSQCGAAFRQNGYAPISGLIHPFHVAALRRYFRQLIRTQRLLLGDSQSSRRYVAHNESVARFFHHQLTAAVSAVAGEPVKPSYVYLASYQGGAELERHTDREQCEFSVTFCLDYSPEPQNHTPWPICLHPPSGTVKVFQAIGDGLLYRGCQLPHSRARLPQGHTSTSIFFHYVRESFSGPMD
jgi:hypothetical protein